MNELFVKSEDKNAEYFALPDSLNPRIIVSRRNAILYRKGFSLHNTAAWRNLFLKFILSRLYLFTGLKQSSLLSAGELKNSLIELMRKNISPDITEVSAYIGTSNNLNRKITLQLIDEEGENLGIIKIPLFEEAHDFIINECEMINKIAELRPLNFFLPEKVKLLEWEGRKILYQNNIFNSGKKVRFSLSDIIVDTSLNLSQKTKSDNSEEYFQGIIDDINLSDLSSPVLSLIKNTLDEIKREKMFTVLIHGDYVPYNMRIKDNRLALVDWEFSRPALPLYDLFHFLFQGYYQVISKNVNKNISRVFNPVNKEYFEYYLYMLNINPHLSRHLFILYLYDSLIFEKKLKQNDESHNSQYLQALKVFCG